MRMRSGVLSLLLALAYGSLGAAPLREFVSEVEFSKAEAVLSSAEAKTVEDLAASLKAIPGCISIVVLTGYADRTEGDKAQRSALGEDRARHIAERLRRLGTWQTSAIAGDYRDTPFAKGWRGRVVVSAVYRGLAPCETPSK